MTDSTPTSSTPAPGTPTDPIAPESAGTTVTATVRGIELGRARPEIIVPLVGDDHDAVLAQADAALKTPARIIEWRIDRFRPDLEDSEDHRDVVLATLPALRAKLGPDKALLATVRTDAEGGSRRIRDLDLAVLLEALMGSRRAGTQSQVDMIDIETSRSPEIVARVITTAHRNGVVVIGSFHDLEGTPDEAEIAELLRSQRRLGADVPKIAVTPRTARDVLTLLSASLTVASERTGPHIAISMGTLGVASRVSAESFGSAATFATAGAPSAPGQLGADDVARMLELLRP
ncbi:type I 3-dehydroquinate dehydratase [Brachybacterium tyrofermentans]|uniref:type I 3-dehydroquinate dehydratase n=1 Tax=Brachybacterium tyrofermentans TaxID=47848 RepID=UPI003FCF35CD